MNYRLLIGLVLIAALVSVGCDANRGKSVARNSNTNAATSSAVTGGEAVTGNEAVMGSNTGGSNDAENKLAKYDNFVVEYPEQFNGEFNPAGLEVGPAVDKLAPEIEGVDLEGTDFKLSDYRGKVVMLDFYGDW